MSVNEAFQQLQHGGTVNCVTPSGVRFQIRSKVSYGIPWYRSFPARRGCLNRYSRLSDSELRQWLESVRIEQ